MHWYKFWERPGVQTNKSTHSDLPANLWEKCPACEKNDYHYIWSQNLNVCQHCGYHKKISALQRFESILEPDYQIISVPKSKQDPISFEDRKKYTDRIKEGKTEENFGEAIALAQGEIKDEDESHKLLMASMDFSFIGGSMGNYVGETILTGCNMAKLNKLPFICFTSSGGARMQEGFYSLMQMPRTTAAVEELKKAGIPFIVVLTDPSMGGVLASFAMLGDITLAEKGATIGFAGRRVIENTVKEKLPDNFQTPEFQYECGFVDQIVHRHQIKNTLSGLLKILSRR